MVPSSDSFLPIMTFIAHLASGTPKVLLTNGTVREARGLTSKMYTSSPFTANWTFMRPTTPSAFARAIVCRSISAAAQHGGRSPHDRIPQPRRDLDRLTGRAGHPAVGLLEAEPDEKIAESRSIFGPIEGVGGGSEDGNAGSVGRDRH